MASSGFCIAHSTRTGVWCLVYKELASISLCSQSLTNTRSIRSAAVGLRHSISEMKVYSILAIVFVAVLYQTNPSGCYWPGGLPVGRLNQFIKSIFVTDKFKELGKQMSASVRVPVDRKIKQLRQLSFSKIVYVNKTVSHSTVTLNLISTTTVSTSQFCARFVGNVAGGCRLRREIYPGEIMESINKEIALLQPTKVQRY